MHGMGLIAIDAATESTFVPVTFLLPLRPSMAPHAIRHHADHHRSDRETLTHLHRLASYRRLVHCSHAIRISIFSRLLTRCRPVGRLLRPWQSWYQDKYQ